MALIFCVRSATRNIGNDIINRATSELILEALGPDTGIANIPALKGPQFGGFTVRQVYDMNRFADGVVLGGGNLFENGQVSVEPAALSVLTPPLLTIGVSHGRIYSRGPRLVERTDGLPDTSIALLMAKSGQVLVRDTATHQRFRRFGDKVQMAGCPTLFMKPNPPDFPNDGSILLSIRNPERMSVPPQLHWRVASDVRRLIDALKAKFGDHLKLVCHDYADIDFASAFPDVPLIYFDDVERYIQALRNCRLNVSYRLHAFLPCLAFGSPTIHTSYDERGSSMVSTAGMAPWDVDLLTADDVVEDVMTRAGNLDRYYELRRAAFATIEPMRALTVVAMKKFAKDVHDYRTSQGLPDEPAN